MSVKIDHRPGQWVGIVLVLALGALTTMALPRYASTTASAQTNKQITEVEAGTRVGEGGVSIAPAEGWSRSTEVPGLLLLKTSDAIFIINPLVPATDQSLSDVVSDQLVAYSDKSLHYEIGDEVDFTTDSGLDGVRRTVVSPDDTTILGAISDGSVTTTFNLAVSAATWSKISDGLEPMLASVELDPDAAPADTAADATEETQ